MAEELTDTEEDSTPDPAGEESEIEELEALLDEEERAQDEEFEKATFYKKLYLLFVYNKESVLKYGGIALGSVAVLGAVYYFAVVRAQDADVGTQVASTQVKEESLPYEIPNIYSLKLFFLPVKTKDGKETGKFIHVKISLLLSHSRLDQDLEKVLPILRTNIFGLLSRKKLKDFKNKKIPIEETLKREILTVSNSLLISGTGVITDVLFTEFMLTSA